jgi:hypothetical protein
MKYFAGTTALLILILFTTYNTGFGQISVDKKSYTVKTGESLLDIAENLGNRDFWKPLYQANTDIIDEGMEAGQVLALPSEVTDSPAFAYVEEAPEQTEEERLEEFRQAFAKVVESKKQNKEESKQHAAETARPEPDVGQADPELDLGVLILDETRSKLGGDFYRLFYQNWKSPEDASNITITISEQPSFGRGTQVNIKIDYEKVFSARLQPRYEYIENVSKQAVARAQREIKQHTDVRQQLTGY